MSERNKLKFLTLIESNEKKLYKVYNMLKSVSLAVQVRIIITNVYGKVHFFKFHDQ